MEAILQERAEEYANGQGGLRPRRIPTDSVTIFTEGVCHKVKENTLAEVTSAFYGT